MMVYKKLLAVILSAFALSDGLLILQLALK